MAVTAWRLLLTRPEADALALQQWLATQGVAGSCFPLLATEPLAPSQILRQHFLALDRYHAVVVVSKPAARAGLAWVDQFWPQPLHDQPWFSVGAATGQILTDYGIDTYWPTDGDDSEALLRLPKLQQVLQTPDCRVLILRGEDGRDFFSQTLRERGVQVDILPVYRRFTPEYAQGALAQRIDDERLNGLVVSSGQGLQALISLLGPDWPRLQATPLFVPSERVAQHARDAGAQCVFNCQGASAEALWNTLTTVSALACLKKG